MKFQNAATGVKRIFTAEILKLIAAIVTVVGIVMTIVTVAAANANSQGGTIAAGVGTVLLIAAASILAKVSRDHLMLELAKEFPQYGFEKHKGYGTKAHYEALRKYGPCPVHRMSFLKSFMG